MMLPAAEESCNKSIILYDRVKSLVDRVRKARRWYRVNPLTKAFVRAYLITGPKEVRSMVLIKAVVKAVRELNILVSKTYSLMRAGVVEAWKLSHIAKQWGHPNAESWRNSKPFIIYQAISLQWLKKLFGPLISLDHTINTGSRT
ncbi:MAG: hypothetical protein QXU87_09920 [Candidatus Caldarchaeum sp.]